MKKKKDRKELAEKMSFEDIYKEVSILKMGLLKVEQNQNELYQLANQYRSKIAHMNGIASVKRKLIIDGKK